MASMMGVGRGWARASLLVACLGLAAAPAPAAAPPLAIGVSLSLKGGDALTATLMLDGIRLAIDEANAAGGVAGRPIETVLLDESTATAGQFDPAQAAVNARKFVADPAILAIVGPQASGSAKAMAPILGAVDLAAITPLATNPDITDPKFAAQFRPQGRPVIFRTVTTDAFQGPGMANFFADTLHLHRVFVLDDGTAYGIGIADSFARQAAARGITVVGRDQVDPHQADYTTALTRIKALGPEALYFGGLHLAGVKLVKQAFDVVPTLVKAGGDGMYGPEIIHSGGFPAAEGWYATTAAPHIAEDPEARAVVRRFVERFGRQPSDYSITAYDAALVVIDALRRVGASGEPLTRGRVRAAIQATALKTLQGVVAFDDEGDLRRRAVSVFQVRHDPAYPDDDVLHQYQYAGMVPQGW